ncbi:succinate dehydrogenase cytochrome b subunit [Leptospira sp. 2 VSF19]|uniref:Succinate dehydrogenase cytochrome b subunit n=1 Tax=Leptospira soteropolitanensis TaxID=2950025 RepID=A0AAW5VI18_9LEPT|nr:succinate dehydrogenase cytochrome b subunit [Leptospira soteropolitanensis]MCW7492188.1 succinate dehydrogenase cytochrome b subunit [Leptospira soteropolitanensis]MCW7499770.1 succinate dehydrogenase cytochrome b subunit [Leptospira soteropolitanensis]MCW7522021.1 succinate dehydrogenase cytochrome b subunit [Leptospira soteropolitanensis]MCW7525875.1 succinate dehydrogenase cytochrome b subunit [Leptospira soteropolitanensis]MCW7530011.1 succinate dehydrogenase cytochrome b subunit [Lept
MTLSLDFFRSSIGKKIIMAITGFIWFGFVILHMVGNLQVFQGPEKLNTYAKFLKDLGPLLWVARIGLIVAFFGHVCTAILLKIENSSARPVSYAKGSTIQASVASRTMAYSGLLLLTFLVYHLAHFTLGITNPEHYSFEYILKNGDVVHDVYAMVILGFQDPIISGTYIVFMIFLALHFSHALGSMFQTLGILAPKHNPTIQKLSTGLGLIIFLGNCSMPISILLGYVR